MTEQEKILEKLDMVDSEITEAEQNLFYLKEKRKGFLERINKLDEQRID